MNASGDFRSLLTELKGEKTPAKHTNLAARPRNNDATANPTARPVSPLKRKSEDWIGGPPFKVAKSDAQRLASNNASRPVSSSGLAPRAAALSLDKDKKTPDSSDAAQEAGYSNRLQGNKACIDKPRPTTPKMPPKGSYRDLIARARVHQKEQKEAPQLPVTKQITPIGRRKQERMEARMRMRQAIKEGKNPNAAAVKTSTADLTSSKTSKGKHVAKQPAEPEVKRKKERPPLEYKGTMRGSSTILTSKSAGSKPAVAPAKKKAAAGYSSASGSELDAPEMGKRYKYADYEDEDEDEDESGEDSDDDMEGGGFDALEAEEEASLRAAKKEDLQALREEEQHARDKQARKNRLQALAAKKKGSKY